MINVSLHNRNNKDTHVTHTIRLVDEATQYNTVQHTRQRGVHSNLDNVMSDMRSAIQDQDPKTIEVGLYQKDNMLAVHGIYEAKPKTMTDEEFPIQAGSLVVDSAQ